MLETHFDIYDRRMMNSLDDLALATGKDVGTLIRDRGPTVARYLAEATQPVADMDTMNPDGGSIKARDMGRAAVRRDIGRVYIGSSKVYNDLRNWSDARTGKALARAFYRAIKRGDQEAARQIVIRAGMKNLKVQAWDGGKTHKQRRNNRGRVGKSNAPVVVDSVKAVKDYVRMKEGRVGFAKAAWYHAGQQIKGGGRIAAWIRNNPAPGRGVDDTQNTDSPRILLTNLVSYVDQILSEGSRQRAVEAFNTSLRKEIQHAMDAIARKQERMANAGSTGEGHARLAA